MTRLVVKIEIDGLGIPRRRVVRSVVSRRSTGRQASKHACVIAARCIARDASRLQAARECKKSWRGHTTKYKRTGADAGATWRSAGVNGRVASATTAGRRSRAHNLPIGTLHYSCLQLQPANQPGPSPTRILSPTPPMYCCIPSTHPWFPPLPAPRPVICLGQIQLQSPRWFWINHQFWPRLFLSKPCLSLQECYK